MPEPIEPPEAERALGLGFYLTATRGAAARLKASPDDFRVREISMHPSPDPEGPFTVLTVVSRDWEQHELTERLARELRRPAASIAWAGTKDRRAVAERLASYRGLPPDRPIDLPGVEIRDVYRARDGLALGHHFGNAFGIRLACPHASGPSVGADLAATAAALRLGGGFANLYGPQRFGEVRPVTHEVGACLVRGDVAGAVDLYLTRVFGAPGTVGEEARRAYAEHHDPVRALREFPPHFRFERQLLEQLRRDRPPARALRALDPELRRLFVHAFQAWIFNRWVTARWSAGVPLDRPVAGDRVVRTGKDGSALTDRAVAVDADTVQEVAATVAAGRARLAGPLVGTDTPRLGGRPGELLEEVLEEVGVTREQFVLPELPELSSRGTWRPVWLDLPPIGVRESCADRPDDPVEHGWWLDFALPKGAYATVVVREFLKSGAGTSTGRSG